MDDTMSGAELFALRNGWGVSIEDIADFLGVNPRTVRRWESGEARLSLPVTAEVWAFSQHLEEIADEIIDRKISVIIRGEVPEVFRESWNVFIAGVGVAVKRGHRVDWA